MENSGQILLHAHFVLLDQPGYPPFPLFYIYSITEIMSACHNLLRQIFWLPITHIRRFLNQGSKGYFFRAVLFSYIVHGLVNSFVFIIFHVAFNLIKK
jgi:hypothetical protein